MEKSNPGDLVMDVDGKEEGFKNVLHKYSEAATMHGLRYVFADSNKTKRVLWVIVLLSMMAGFSVTFIRSLIQYYQYDTVTSIQIQRRKTLLLPSITMCNVNVGKETKLANFSKEYTTFLHTATGLISGLDIAELPIPEISKTILYKDFDNLFGYTTKDMFVSCNIGSKTVNCEDYIITYVTDRGVCKTFNSNNHISQHGVTKIQSAGPSYGVTFTLDVDPDDYGHPKNLGDGYAILVHDPNQVPLMQEKSFYVSPGKEYFYGVKKTDSKSLPSPYSETDCVADPDDYNHQLSGNQRYSYEGCKHKCFIDFISVYCGCDFGSKTDLTPCTMWDTSSCKPKSTALYYDSGEDCGCLPTCDRTDYQGQLSSLDFPNRLMSDFAAQMNWPVQNLTEMRKRYLHLHIYYESMEEVLNQQVAVIDITQLLSNFGGMMGLYMGASIISVLEILEFVVSLMGRCCKRNKLNDNLVMGIKQ